MTTRSVPWPRIFAEGVAIVVSILLAFGIQAWWEDRQEREEERRTLTALVEEFSTNLDRLDLTECFHSEIRASANIILNAVAEDTDLSHDSITHLLSDLGWWRRTDFQTGAVDAVLLGGGLSVIENEDLRRQLADWKRALEVFLRNENQDYDTYREVWMPFLRSQAYLPAIVASAGPYPCDPDGAYYEPPAPTLVRDVGIDHRSLLANREFHNVLIQKRTVQDDVLALSGDLSQRLAGVLDLLRAEIRR